MNSWHVLACVFAGACAPTVVLGLFTYSDLVWCIGIICRIKRAVTNRIYGFAEQCFPALAGTGYLHQGWECYDYEWLAAAVNTVPKNGQRMYLDSSNGESTLVLKHNSLGESLRLFGLIVFESVGINISLLRNSKRGPHPKACDSRNICENLMHCNARSRVGTNYSEIATDAERFVSEKRTAAHVSIGIHTACESRHRQKRKKQGRWPVITTAMCCECRAEECTCPTHMLAEAYIASDAAYYDGVVDGVLRGLTTESEFGLMSYHGAAVDNFPQGSMEEFNVAVVRSAEGCSWKVYDDPTCDEPSHDHPVIIGDEAIKTRIQRADDEGMKRYTVEKKLSMEGYVVVEVRLVLNPGSGYFLLPVSGLQARLMTKVGGIVSAELPDVAMQLANNRGADIVVCPSGKFGAPQSTYSWATSDVAIRSGIRCVGAITTHCRSPSGDNVKIRFIPERMSASIATATLLEARRMGNHVMLIVETVDLDELTKLTGEQMQIVERQKTLTIVTSVCEDVQASRVGIPAESVVGAARRLKLSRIVDSCYTYTVVFDLDVLASMRATEANRLVYGLIMRDKIIRVRVYRSSGCETSLDGSVTEYLKQNGIWVENTGRNQLRSLLRRELNKSNRVCRISNVRNGLEPHSSQRLTHIIIEDADHMRDMISCLACARHEAHISRGSGVISSPPRTTKKGHPYQLIKLDKPHDHVNRAIWFLHESDAYQTGTGVDMDLNTRRCTFGNRWLEACQVERRKSQRDDPLSTVLEAPPGFFEVEGVISPPPGLPPVALANTALDSNIEHWQEGPEVQQANDDRVISLAEVLRHGDEAPVSVDSEDIIYDECAGVETITKAKLTRSGKTDVKGFTDTSLDLLRGPHGGLNKTRRDVVDEAWEAAPLRADRASEMRANWLTRAKQKFNGGLRPIITSNPWADYIGHFTQQRLCRPPPQGGKGPFSLPAYTVLADNWIVYMEDNAPEDEAKDCKAELTAALTDGRFFMTEESHVGEWKTFETEAGELPENYHTSDAIRYVGSVLTRICEWAHNREDVHEIAEAFHGDYEWEGDSRLKHDREKGGGLTVTLINALKGKNSSKNLHCMPEIAAVTRAMRDEVLGAASPVHSVSEALSFGSSARYAGVAQEALDMDTSDADIHPGYLPRCFKDGNRSRHVEGGFSFDPETLQHTADEDTEERARLVQGERKEHAIFSRPFSDFDQLVDTQEVWTKQGRAGKFGKTYSSIIAHMERHSIPTADQRGVTGPTNTGGKSGYRNFREHPDDGMFRVKPYDVSRCDKKYTFQGELNLRATDLFSFFGVEALVGTTISQINSFWTKKRLDHIGQAGYAVWYYQVIGFIFEKSLGSRHGPLQLWGMGYALSGMVRTMWTVTGGLILLRCVAPSGITAIKMWHCMMQLGWTYKLWRRLRFHEATTVDEEVVLATKYQDGAGPLNISEELMAVNAIRIMDSDDSQIGTRNAIMLPLTQLLGIWEVICTEHGYRVRPLGGKGRYEHADLLCQTVIVVQDAVAAHMHFTGTLINAFGVNLKDSQGRPCREIFSRFMNPDRRRRTTASGYVNQFIGSLTGVCVNFSGEQYKRRASLDSLRNVLAASKVDLGDVLLNMLRWKLVDGDLNDLEEVMLMNRLDGFAVRLLQWNFPDGYDYPDDVIKEEMESIGLDYDETFCRSVWRSRVLNRDSQASTVEEYCDASDSDCDDPTDAIVGAEDGQEKVTPNGMSGLYVQATAGVRMGIPEICALDCSLTPVQLIDGKSVEELVQDWKSCELLNSSVAAWQTWNAYAPTGHDSMKVIMCARVCEEYVEVLERKWKRHAGKDLTHLHRRYTETIDGASIFLKAACFRRQCMPPRETMCKYKDADGWIYIIAHGELPGMIANAVLRAYDDVRILVVSLESDLSSVTIPVSISRRVQLVVMDALKTWRKEEVVTHEWYAKARISWSDLWLGGSSAQSAAHSLFLNWCFGSDSQIEWAIFKAAGSCFGWHEKSIITDRKLESKYCGLECQNQTAYECYHVVKSVDRVLTPREIKPTRHCKEAFWRLMIPRIYTSAIVLALADLNINAANPWKKLELARCLRLKSYKEVSSDTELAKARSFGAMCIWSGEGDFITDIETSTRSLTVENVATMHWHNLKRFVAGAEVTCVGGGDGWWTNVLELLKAASVTTYDINEETVARCSNNVTSKVLQGDYYQLTGIDGLSALDPHWTKKAKPGEEPAFSCAEQKFHDHLDDYAAPNSILIIRYPRCASEGKRYGRPPWRRPTFDEVYIWNDDRCPSGRQACFVVLRRCFVIKTVSAMSRHESGDDHHRIVRALTFLLRHRLSYFDVFVDDTTIKVPLDPMLRELQALGYNVKRKEVMNAIGRDEKKRIHHSKGMFWACEGHSSPSVVDWRAFTSVTVEYLTASGVRWLAHGTTKQKGDLIMKEGLLPGGDKACAGRRLHNHLVQYTAEEWWHWKLPSSTAYVVWFDVCTLTNATLWLSDNGVILTRDVIYPASMDKWICKD